MLNHYYFFLSGEHSKLPIAEIEAILESEQIPTGQMKSYDQVLLIDTTFEGMSRIAARAAMVHNGGLHLLSIRIDQSDWITPLKTALSNIEIPLRSGSSFVVRVRRVKHNSSHIETPDLERFIGACFLKQHDLSLHVNLKSPNYTVYGILTDEFLVLGLKLFSIKRSSFDTRRAHFRHFVHPSAINPRFARMMVNLSRASPKNHFLDPFTGSGGLLIEAGMIGCYSTGIEIDPIMIHGAQSNLQTFKIDNYALIVGDARSPPIQSVSAIATDPPYGTSSSTKGITVSELVTDALMAAKDVLIPGGYICIATPNLIPLESLGKHAGLQHHSSYLQFVHRSLTRIIGVFSR